MLISDGRRLGGAQRPDAAEVGRKEIVGIWSLHAGDFLRQGAARCNWPATSVRGVTVSAASDPDFGLGADGIECTRGLARCVGPGSFA